MEAYSWLVDRAPPLTHPYHASLMMPGGCTCVVQQLAKDKIRDLSGVVICGLSGQMLRSDGALSVAPWQWRILHVRSRGMTLQYDVHVRCNM